MFDLVLSFEIECTFEHRIALRKQKTKKMNEGLFWKYIEEVYQANGIYGAERSYYYVEQIQKKY